MASPTFTFNSALYATWKTNTGNVFIESQDKDVIKWLTTSATKLCARRKASNDIIAEMKICIEEGGNNAETRAQTLVTQGQQCLQAAHEERKQAQDEFDRILTPIQRVRIIIHAVERVNDNVKAADILASILADACEI